MDPLIAEIQVIYPAKQLKLINCGLKLGVRPEKYGLSKNSPESTGHIRRLMTTSWQSEAQIDGLEILAKIAPLSLSVDELRKFPQNRLTDIEMSYESIMELAKNPHYYIRLIQNPNLNGAAVSMIYLPTLGIHPIYGLNVCKFQSHVYSKRPSLDFLIANNRIENPLEIFTVEELINLAPVVKWGTDILPFLHGVSIDQAAQIIAFEECSSESMKFTKRDKLNEWACTHTSSPPSDFEKYNLNIQLAFRRKSRDSAINYFNPAQTLINIFGMNSSVDFVIKAFLRSDWIYSTGWEFAWHNMCLQKSSSVSEIELVSLIKSLAIGSSGSYDNNVILMQFRRCWNRPNSQISL